MCSLRVHHPSNSLWEVLETWVSPPSERWEYLYVWCDHRGTTVSHLKQLFTPTYDCDNSVQVSPFTSIGPNAACCQDDRLTPCVSCPWMSKKRSSTLLSPSPCADDSRRRDKRWFRSTLPRWEWGWNYYLRQILQSSTLSISAPSTTSGYYSYRHSQFFVSQSAVVVVVLITMMRWDVISFALVEKCDVHSHSHSLFAIKIIIPLIITVYCWVPFKWSSSSICF